jgi:hypothetical protein
MPRPDNQPERNRPDSKLEWIDAVADRFEAAWKNHRQSRNMPLS